MIRPSPPAPSKRRGFTLVEVVLAVGIASFSLVVMLGVFGSVVKTRGDNISRKEAFDAAYALQSHMSEPNAFVQVYNWVRTEAKEIVYVCYKTDANGVPDASGDRYRSEWLEPSAITSAMTTAIEGRWIKAIIEWDDRDHVNPLQQDELPANPTDYPDARATLRARLYAVPSPSMAITSEMPPAITTSLTLHR